MNPYKASFIIGFSPTQIYQQKNSYIPQYQVSQSLFRDTKERVEAASVV
jgi:hypothetical protein